MTKPVMSLVVAAAISIAATALAGPEHDHGKKDPVLEIGKDAPDFMLPGVDGKEYKLSQYSGKYIVLEWTNADCPFVRKHYGSGNMQKLQKTWVDKGVVWLTICSSAPGKQGYYEAGVVSSKMKESKSDATAYLLDSSGKVGRLYQARTTPHMFVIDPAGKLIYAGAIDDRPSTKTEDIDGATNYVQACLTAAMAGKKVEVATSTPYGCSVKYAD